MSEDVVEFGGTPAQRARSSRFNIRLPRLPMPVSVLLSGLAVVTALLSVTMTWQTSIYDPNGQGADLLPSAGDREINYDATGTTFGVVYMFTLLAIAVSVVLALRGVGPAQENARLTGLTSGAFAAALVGLSIYTVASNPDRLGGFYGASSEVADLYTVQLKGGIFAAMATVLLSLAALVFSRLAPAPLLTPSQAPVLEEYDDEVDELTVIVEPTEPVTPSHELYMRK